MGPSLVEISTYIHPLGNVSVLVITGLTPTTKSPIIELEVTVLIIQNKWNGFCIEIWSVLMVEGFRKPLLLEFQEGSLAKYRDVNFEKHVIWALAK